LLSRFSARRLAAALVVGALAGLLTFLVYRETLHYGLDYDDYHFLRPYSTAEVLASFHGPWDLSGVMVKFFRPLTVAFSAVRFELFGLNAVAHHAMSLTLFALAAVLVAWLTHRATSRASATILAVVFFICHPAMPYSLVAWITNQMHLLQILTVLAALVWWDAVRARHVVWWLPLLLFGAASFLIKEDGVMLLPAVVVLHEIRRRLVERDLPRVHWSFIGLCVLLLLGLVAVRAHVLGELGGYGRPTPSSAWRNVSSTLYGMYRLIPADREWQPLASWFVTSLPLVALAAWRWISPAARYCMAAGAAIALLFAVLFIFATKAEQVYLVALGLSLVLTGGSVALLDLASRVPGARTKTVLAGLVLATGIGSLVSVTRAIARDFEPFGPIVLSHDDIVRTWGHVAPELREYVAAKREPGAAGRLSSNPADELAVVSFNFHGPEVTPDGVPYMWMAGRWAEVHVRALTREATIPVRHAIEAFSEPARMRLEADGRLADDLVLDSSAWRVSSTALRRGGASPLRRMHRLRITIDHAWLPSEVIPGSTDGRLLGLQIGTVKLR